MSDLHLEFYKLKFIMKPIPDDKDTNLILNGDIGYPFSLQYQDFIDHCSKEYKNVIITAGNHEYYQGKRNRKQITEINKKIQSIADSYDNVYYLQNTSICFDEDENFLGELDDLINTDRSFGIRYVIIGCTLWTDIPVYEILNVRTNMNDYYRIYKDSDTGLHENISVSNIIDLHQKSVEFIKDQLEKIKSCRDTLKDVKVIIMTHHSPTMKSVHRNDPLKHAYSSDLEYLIWVNPCIKYWVFGHTHINVTIRINETDCISNCRGYRSETIGFIQNKTILL
jgi:predicted phosphodiesterase